MWAVLIRLLARLRQCISCMANYCFVTPAKPLHKLAKAIILAVNYQGAIKHVGEL